MQNTPIAAAYILVGGLVFLLGIVILREAPRERANRATALMLFFGGIGSVLGAIGFVLEELKVTPQAASADFLRSFNYVWEFFFPSLLYFASIFPEELPLLRRIPFHAVWIFAPHTFHLILMVLQSQTPLWGRVTAWAAQNPGAHAVLSVVRLPVELALRFHGILFSVVNLFYIAAALSLLFLSYRRTHNPLLRVQVRTIFLGLASCAGLYALAVPIPTLFNQSWPAGTRSSLIVAALVLGSGAIAYSMVRHRFLDANLIARKSILYAVTSAFLLLVYFTVVRQIDAFLETVPGYDTTLLQTVLLLLALVLFQPLFSWLEELLESFFLRDRGDHRTILRRVSGEVLTVLDLETLAEKLLKTLREGLLSRSAVLVVAPEGGDRMARGFGGALDLAAIGRIPRESLLLLMKDRDLLHRIEIPARVEELGGGEAYAPLLAAQPHLVLTLRHTGEFVGLLALGRKITETRFTAEEVALLQTLANQASVAVKNALLYRESLAKTILEEELAVARRIQQQLLPTTFPETHGFDLAALNIPSKQVGGDSYDVVPLGNGDTILAIADVAGKGVPAALLASMVQAAIRTQAPDRKPISEMMDRLNRLVHEATPADRFATCFLGRVSGATLSFSNAGHNYPILLSRNGGCRTLEAGGIPLGIMPEFRYGEVGEALRAGDTLLLYTDGITDARNRSGEDYGEARLLAIASGLPRDLVPARLLREIVDDVARFTEGAEQMDDMTLVALQAR